MLRRSLLLTAASAVLMVSLGVGATLALFTDATDSQTNTFTAGRLCLESQRNTGDTVPGPMFYMLASQGHTGSEPGRYPMAELSPNSPGDFVPETPGGWAPGDSAIRTLTVYNGSMDCRSLEARLTHVTASLQAGSYAPLANKMKVTVYAQSVGGLKQIAQAYLSDFLDPNGVEIRYPAPSLQHPTLPAFTGMMPSNLHMEFKVEFDLDTPNEYQDKDMIVDFTVHGEQVKNNP